MDTAAPNSNHFASRAVDMVNTARRASPWPLKNDPVPDTFTISIDQMRHAR